MWNRAMVAALLSATLLRADAPGTVPSYRPAADHERKAFLLSAEVIENRGLKEGITASRRLTLVRNSQVHDAHFQTVNEREDLRRTHRGIELYFRDCYRFNIAAYALSRYLGIGMVPVSVERKIGGRKGALSWWVDDGAITSKERHKRGAKAPDPARWTRQMQTVRVFDALIANSDRNLGNLLITDKWDVWMIDHTRAFRRLKKIQNTRTLPRCDRRMLEQMRSLDRQTLSEIVGDTLEDREMATLLDRARQLVEHFDAEIARRGAENVLYNPQQQDERELIATSVAADASKAVPERSKP